MKKLYLDQYGNRFYAATVKDLRKQIGGGGSKVSIMYRDSGKDVLRVGYVIGEHWLNEYLPNFRKVN